MSDGWLPPDDPLGKKLLVMGDINAGKTTLCRQWLARLCAQGQGGRIVVLDLAPDIPPALAQARGLAGAGGYLLPPPDSDVLDLRTHLHAPRLSSATEAEAEEKANNERAATDARQKECSEAKAQLLAMQDGQRVARFAENGERVVLDDAEHEAEVERLSKYVARNCK